MEQLRRPVAVVFDLDGTLVDTVPARIASWRDALDEAGIPYASDALGPMIGMDGKRLAFEAGSAAGVEVDDARAEEIDRRAGMLFDRHNTRPRTLPGAHDLLASLDETGVAWAIATSSRAEQVAASITALDLKHPPRIVDGSRVAHAKPAPDLLLLAADELRVDAHGTWYVGDSAWDMRAAVAAGMVPIAVTAGAAVGASALREAGAAVVVETLEQLQLPD